MARRTTRPHSRGRGGERQSDIAARAELRPNRISHPNDSRRLKRRADRRSWGLDAGIVGLSDPSHTIMQRYRRAMVADDTRIGQQPGVRMPDVQQAYRRLPDHV